MTIEEAFGPLLARRECGACTACCTVPRIDALAKPADTTCIHRVDTGCSIYAERPGSCRAFFCGWRRLRDLPDNLRPDRSGVIVMLELAPGAANPFERKYLVARGIDAPPSLDSALGKRLLALAKRARLPLFFSAPGSSAKSLIHPGPAIYWPIVRGDAPGNPAEVARWRRALSATRARCCARGGGMIPATIAAFSASALPWLDLFGIAVFAASGALAAAKLRADVVTFLFFACITGTGGGTVRDLLIGAPVFWMHTPAILGICLGVGLLVWLTPRRLWSDHALDWFDAAGLGAYAAYGAAKALAFGIHPLPAAGMGIITACAGGIIRDILAHQPSIFLRREIYVTAAALSAGTFVALALAGLAPIPAAAIAAAAGFALRGLAIARGLALPAYPRG